MSFPPMRLALLFGSLAAACGGASSQPSQPTASQTPPLASASATARDVTHCPRTAEELARALRAVASHDVPPPTSEEKLSEPEWTDELRTWNGLQSERLRAAEGARTPGVSWRHRVWVHQLRATTAAWERGPFHVESEANGAGYLQAGSLDSSEALTVRVVEESGCLRIDDN